MRNLCFSIGLLIACFSDLQAQWQKCVGLNMLPLIARTIELTSEFGPHPAYALTVNVGYTHRSPFDGIVKVKVYDGVKDRQSSGGFLKVGGRLYLLSLTGRQPPVNLFAGAQLIGSQYHQTGTVQIIDPGFSPVPQAPYVEANGFVWGAAVTGGLTVRMAKRVTLDGGIQYGFQPTRHDYIGDRSFNYQPGFGISRTGSRVTSLQGILTVKYRL